MGQYAYWPCPLCILDIRLKTPCTKWANMHTGHPICVLARVLALTFALCPAPAPAGSVLGQAITQPAHPAPPLTAMVLSNDTIVLFFCLPSIKRPIWILRVKAILGVQYAYWTFMKSSMHIGHFSMPSLHTGLDETQYANWMSSMHMGPVFKWGAIYIRKIRIWPTIPALYILKDHDACLKRDGTGF